MNKNDSTIIALKNKIAEKQVALGNKPRFAPRTSCILDFNGNKYNFNVCGKDTLTLLMCELHSIALAAKDLEITDSIVVSGFPIADWIADIKDKLSVIDYANKRTELMAFESKLNALLTNDTKTELEIAEIAAMLGD